MADVAEQPPEKCLEQQTVPPVQQPLDSEEQTLTPEQQTLAPVVHHRRPLQTQNKQKFSYSYSNAHLQQLLAEEKDMSRRHSDQSSIKDEAKLRRGAFSTDRTHYKYYNKVQTHPSPQYSKNLHWLQTLKSNYLMPTPNRNIKRHVSAVTLVPPTSYSLSFCTDAF